MVSHIQTHLRFFENEYEYDDHTLVRRKAYETFYQKLAEYQHGFASNYQAHVQKEKIMSELRGLRECFLPIY